MVVLGEGAVSSESCAAKAVVVVGCHLGDQCAPFHSVAYEFSI